MKGRTHIAAAVAAALLTWAPVSTQAQTDEPAIDPGTVTALNRMAAYLQSLRAFQVEADVTREEVLEDGQKVQFASVAKMIVERPNRLRLEVKSDKRQRTFFYDGSSFTVFAPQMQYYAAVDAPPTIGELIDRLEEKYELQLPLVDFFRWNSPDAFLGEITSAKDLGPSQVGGATTQHYMIRQEGLDWQIWIQNGDFPLPRKVVLTTMTDEARPQYTAVYTWNLAPSFNNAAFVFTAPADAKKIPMGDVPTELEPRTEVEPRTETEPRR